MINHVTLYNMVMLVEIPDFEVIFAVIVAFLVGLFAFFVYYKVKPFVNVRKTEVEPDHLERLEYYERQLIDMKIRLDAIDMEMVVPETPQTEAVIKPATDGVTYAVTDGDAKHPTPPIMEKSVETTPKPQRLPNMTINNAVDYVLHLITDKSMTSRDIQITLGRSREHTSRLMKKLFEDGFAQRNENNKPYTYSITSKGKEKIGIVDQVAVVV